MESDFKTGDRVKGAFSGRYLGVLLGIWWDTANIREPDGTETVYPLVFIEPVPEIEQESGRTRIWV